MNLLNDKQKEFWRSCDSRWNIKAGATRSGKTYMDYYLIPKRLLDLRDKSGYNVIIGNTLGTVNRNIIIPMQNIYGEKRVGNLKSSKGTVEMFGQTVYVFGADNKSRVNAIRGMSIKYCYGDEITTWSAEVFDMLKSRLDRDYSVFDGTCNPDSPNHWFKEFLDSDADIYQQHYTIDDNSRLSSKVVTELKKEYAGTVYYDRYILGLWALAEGVIYRDYKVALADTSEIDVSMIKHSDLCLSVDYGTMNPFAVLLWAKVKNVWYAVDEYYYSGRDTGTTKTDSQYADDIYRWLTGLGIKLSREDKIELIIDPSASSMKSELKLRGFYKIRSADNDVINGIQNTATAMQLGLIKFSDLLENWQNEIQGYAWMDDPTEDRPIKEDDHCLTGDTLVMTDKGSIPIRDLVGTSGNVYSFNINSKKAEIKAYHDCRLTQKNALIYQITMEDGRIIKCTAEHPILTERGYVKAQYLKESDKVIDL